MTAVTVPDNRFTRADTLPAGAGFGAVTQGALRLLLPPAAPQERAGTLAA